uniref:Uncharacterized protein n=1 Tax=Arundo donax TaxID=35708 RepID=A0A0A9AZB2_ARUDO
MDAGGWRTRRTTAVRRSV